MILADKLIGLLQQAELPSSTSKPEYTNFYVRPGEKLDIQQGNEVGANSFITKKGGGVVRGTGIAERGIRKAKMY